MNPFKPGSTQYVDFNTLSDLQWHCTKCELKSGQAKTWQVWRQMGIQLATDEKGNYYKTLLCSRCQQRTVHRALVTLNLSEDTTIRSGIPLLLAKRIKELYRYEEAVFLRMMLPKELEIDHKFPQARWNDDEAENNPDMNEIEIKSKFILLNRSNNLTKSRNCERCVATNQRGNFPGIYFWYEGNQYWNKEYEPYDERGCIGCFWYDPYEWRKQLNSLVNKMR